MLRIGTTIICCIYNILRLNRYIYDHLTFILIASWSSHIKYSIDEHNISWKGYKC